MSNRIYILFFLSGLLFSCKQKTFIRTDAQNFFQGDKAYRFVGCNYWYGGFLFYDSANNGQQRLRNELDFLKTNGIRNLRVFVCAEGDSTYPYRIYPSLQDKPNHYNEAISKGFDYLLDQASQRDMKIVFVLSNNWEWSGGFGQYLEWSGKGTPPLPKTNAWDWNAYCKYIAQFYACTACKKWYFNWIEYILNRKNTLNGKRYKDDEAIMAWELANEPRPMDSFAVQDYVQWIKETSAFIKMHDKNHLVTTGVEGIIGTMMCEQIFSNIHSLEDIDYATIHLWPKTWQWYSGDDEAAVSDTTLRKTKQYIEMHARLMKKINKPLVIEEFGLHRDSYSFSPEMPVLKRDIYYRYIFDIGRINNIAGYNFWGALGLEENITPDHFMIKGMSYSADPPQEEQGLYSVFLKDTSTWKIIRKYSKKTE